MAAGATGPKSDLIPARVSDELAWELVRDEWELLLAVGSGPTSAEAAARAMHASAKEIERRLGVLLTHKLVTKVEDGYQLVPAFYERREGMSSYLRDLVLRRMQDESAPPVAGRARLGLGSAAALEAVIARGESDLFPEVVALANRPESERSQRFSVFFAVADAPDAGAAPVLPYDGRGFRQQLLRVLKAAATARSLNPDTRSAYLWVAEMRTDPEVAVEIGDLFERFLDDLPLPHDPSGHGAVAFAVLPASPKRQGES